MQPALGIIRAVIIADDDDVTAPTFSFFYSEKFLLVHERFDCVTEAVASPAGS